MLKRISNCTLNSYLTGLFSNKQRPGLIQRTNSFIRDSENPEYAEAYKRGGVTNTNTTTINARSLEVRTYDCDYNLAGRALPAQLFFI